MEDNYGFIYITTNNINGKKYIGQKNYDKKGKWKKYLGSGIYLNKAISKYGKENFSREIIDYGKTREELNEKERYWIAYFNACHSDNFYNIARGGDGGWVNEGKSEEEIRKIYRERCKNFIVPLGEDSFHAKLSNCDVNKIIHMMLNGMHNVDIAKEFGVDECTIYDIRVHKTWKHMTEGIIFPPSDRKTANKFKKSVDVYDLDGNFINTYESAREIERKLKVSYKLVSQVCNGEKRQSHGYVFRFHNDPFDL